MNLDQHLGHNDRGDGRKFTKELWADGKWFEPVFYINEKWYGVDDTKQACFYKSDGEWYEYSAKNKKEVTLYSPVLQHHQTKCIYTSGHYHHDQSFIHQTHDSKIDHIVGWHEIKVLVEL